MARPRVFISSTFFDLRQVRADLERFVKDLGYDTVRNETGDIPYGRDQKLEEYCYKEISEIDILVGVVGGRFGSEAERGNYSITQIEIKTAIEQNKQVYLFIEKNVLAEYQTYLINKENDSIKYRFADDKRIYKFIEEIYALPKNNIIHAFETALDITSFLREQWAGLFRDLLTQQTQKGQYDNMSLKVNELNEVASTLQTYLENILTNVSTEKDVTNTLISKEQKRLENFQLMQRLKEIGYIDHLTSTHELTIEQVVTALNKAKTFSDLRTIFLEDSKINNDDNYTYECLFSENSLRDIDRARNIIGKPVYELSDAEKQLMSEDLPYRKSIKRMKARTTPPFDGQTGATLVA